MEKILFLDWENTDLRESKFGVVSFEQDKCNGCNWCVQACPSNALEINEKKARMIVPNECQACGDCQAICPNEAISVVESCQWPGYYKLVERGKLVKPRLNW
ncbi:hypothetical protein JCM15765_31910 [Paradesulfitobacterium aromaticivorans]